MERQIFRFVTIIIVQTASLKRLCVECHSFTSVIHRVTLLLTRFVILGEATRAYNSHRARVFLYVSELCVETGISTINRYSKLQIEQDIWYPRYLVNQKYCHNTRNGFSCII